MSLFWILKRFTQKTNNMLMWCGFNKVMPCDEKKESSTTF